MGNGPIRRIFDAGGLALAWGGGRYALSMRKVVWSFLWMSLVGAGLAWASPSPTRPVGASCDDYPGGEACVSRIAIDTPLGCFCSGLCETDAQCPSGWLCNELSQGGGEVVRLCMPRRHAP